MRRMNYWSQPQVQTLLRAMYETATSAELLAAFPGSTFAGIRRAGSRAGLTRPSMNSRKWTVDETRLLRKLYGTAPKPQILAAFPRLKWGTLIKRAGLLGLKRSKSVTPQGRLTNSPMILALRNRRIALGLRLGDVAHAAGYARSTIGSAENGRTVPPWPVLEAWATALGMTLGLTVTHAPLAKMGTVPPEKKRGRRVCPMKQQAAIDMAAWKRKQDALERGMGPVVKYDNRKAG